MKAQGDLRMGWKATPPPHSAPCQDGATPRFERIPPEWNLLIEFSLNSKRTRFGGSGKGGGGPKEGKVLDCFWEVFCIGVYSLNFFNRFTRVELQLGDGMAAVGWFSETSKCNCSFVSKCPKEPRVGFSFVVLSRLWVLLGKARTQTKYLLWDTLEGVRVYHQDNVMLCSGRGLLAKQIRPKLASFTF